MPTKKVTLADLRALRAPDRQLALLEPRQMHRFELESLRPVQRHEVDATAGSRAESPDARSHWKDARRVDAPIAGRRFSATCRRVERRVAITQSSVFSRHHQSSGVSLHNPSSESRAPI